MNDMRKLIERIENINESPDNIIDDVYEFMTNPGNFALYSEKDQRKFWAQLLAELESSSEREF